MMELQGAIGIAQLAKLDYMITAQQAHKSRLKEAASALPGVGFRCQVDELGDSATFFAFTLESPEHRIKVQKVLGDQGVAPICWADNNWHFYPKWEHLLNGSTLSQNGWPFIEPGGRKRLVYDPAALPKSAALLARTLVYPVSVKMSETRLAELEAGLKKAATV
jgi:8-amino-3,8-dideoxy-alpha-D-manno-octulosonate transaminase